MNLERSVTGSLIRRGPTLFRRRPLASSATEFLWIQLLMSWIVRAYGLTVGDTGPGWPCSRTIKANLVVTNGLELPKLCILLLGRNTNLASTSGGDNATLVMISRRHDGGSRKWQCRAKLSRKRIKWINGRDRSYRNGSIDEASTSRWKKDRRNGNDFKKRGIERHRLSLDPLEVL